MACQDRSLNRQSRLAPVSMLALALTASFTFALPARAQVANMPMPEPSLRYSASRTADWDAIRLHGPYPSLPEIAVRCGTPRAAPVASADEGSYTGSGITPANLAGVITVSPEQAKCLIDSFPGKVFVADAAGDDVLPDAADFRFASSKIDESTANDFVQQTIATFLGEAAPGAKNVPIIVYCHHTSCGLSVMAAKRIRALGYSEVFWMREGIKGWRDANYPVMQGDSRWAKPWRVALGKWRGCSLKAEPPAGTDEVDKMAVAVIGMCRAQETEVYRQFGPWYSEAIVSNSIKSMRQEVLANMSSYLEMRAKAAKQRAEDEKDDAKWKHIVTLIEGATPAQLHTEYEWCKAKPFDFRTGDSSYYSTVHAIRAPNFSDDAEGALANLNFRMLRSSALSGPDHNFENFVKKSIGSSDVFWSDCNYAATAEEASADRTKSMAGNKPVVELDWRP